MARRLLVSGDRSSFTTLAFNVDECKLEIIANYPAPYNASWVEPSFYVGNLNGLIGISEGEEDGLLYSFEIDHIKKSCKTTSQRQTLAGPAHFITLKDSSAIVLGTYNGGSIALYPIDASKEHGVLLSNAARSEILPSFPYQADGHGPNQARQRQCHVHQILEHETGLLYAPDLGADRVWVLLREGLQVQIRGWLQCPPGTGPRHAVLNPDQSIMYVIGELSHTVLAFDLSPASTGPIHPTAGFAPNIIPPTVHPEHQAMMDSSEICLHPKHPNVLYVSNRWERHIARRDLHLKDVCKELPIGDTITILMLSGDGRQIQAVSYVQTHLDVIRGMRVSEDGRYVVAGGQEGGGIEIYEIGGARGEALSLVTSLKEGLESGIKHAVWL